MSVVTRFEVELHPEARSILNAWRATGFARDGAPVPFAVGYGDKPATALVEALANELSEQATA